MRCTARDEGWAGVEELLEQSERIAFQAMSSASADSMAILRLFLGKPRIHFCQEISLILFRHLVQWHESRGFLLFPMLVILDIGRAFPMEGLPGCV
jgi:hypothetical protein